MKKDERFLKLDGTKIRIMETKFKPFDKSRLYKEQRISLRNKSQLQKKEKKFTIAEEMTINENKNMGYVTNQDPWERQF
jgi:hypothetical protein